MSERAGSEDVEAIYATAGWGQRVPRGRRPAVLVVDLSRGFTDERYPTGADLTSAVESTARLIGVARAAGAPTIFTTIAYEPADVEGEASGWLRKAAGLAILRAGSPLAEIDPRLPREPTDPLVVKKGASAFFGTELAATLVSLGVDTLLICGATTSGCVRASAVDAAQYGFAVLVPEACVGDRASAPHEANLFDIDAKYGDVIGLDDALEFLLSTAPPQPDGDDAPALTFADLDALTAELAAPGGGQGPVADRFNRSFIDAFRRHDGHVPGEVGTLDVLLLTTKGAKTGKDRTTPVVYVEIDGRILVVASMGGSDRHPSWYHNVRTNPELTVELGEETFAARAVAVEGPLRDRLFAASPVFTEYQARTSRVLPVLELQRR
ncbi:MAG: isochorismatase family protein [Actinobacteria bacterium]|nr:isochorismatase family protein [Actinomycetota bacterium]